jgi:hypothetical protein
MCQKNTVQNLIHSAGGGLRKIEVFSLQSLTIQVHMTTLRYSQVKIKLSLSLIKHHAMKENVGVDVWLHAF